MAITTDSVQGIKRILDTSIECLYALKNIGIKIDEWDVVLVHLIVQKLPTETHLLWEQSLANTKELPKWDELTTFLEGRQQLQG